MSRRDRSQLKAIAWVLLGVALGAIFGYVIWCFVVPYEHFN